MSYGVYHWQRRNNGRLLDGTLEKRKPPEKRKPKKAPEGDHLWQKEDEKRKREESAEVVGVENRIRNLLREVCWVSSVHLFWLAALPL
jgi:hypothetical protein